MTAAGLLTDLRARGVILQARRDRIRYRPADRVTEADLETLRAHKPDLLALLRDVTSLERDGTRTRLRWLWSVLPESDRTRLRSEAEDGDPIAGLILAAASDARAPEAWLLYSRRVDAELWLARDAAALELIRDELDGSPVVFAHELPALRGLDTHALRAVLNAKAAFLGARVIPGASEPRTGLP